MNCKVDGEKATAHLPAPAKRNCADFAKCNAGQELVLSKSSKKTAASTAESSGPATECRWCRDGSWSDGRQACQPCPPNTSPDYTLDYRIWDAPKLPPQLTTACISTTGTSVLYYSVRAFYMHTTHQKNNVVFYSVLYIQYTKYKIAAL